MDGDKIKHQCAKYKNQKYEDVGIIEKHMYQNGFIDGYRKCIAYGEPIVPVQRNPPQTCPIPLIIEPESMIVEEDKPIDQGMEDMIRDGAGPEFDQSKNDPAHESNIAAKKFIG